MLRPRPPATYLRRLAVLGPCAVALAAIGCAGAAPAIEAPPETRVEVVTDVIHGERFDDPYRWLEAQDAPETRAWLAAQTAYADRVLPRDEMRRSLEQRLTALMDRAEIGSPRRGGDMEYFTLRRPGEALAAIYRRPAPGEGTPRSPIAAGERYEMVVDPLPLSPDATTRVELVAVDRAGRHLVYAVRDGGQDETALRIRDLSTGQDLPEQFPAGLYSSVVPVPDGSGFYYSLRSRQTGARIRRHAWRTPIADDVEIFGAGYGPRSYVSVLASDDGRWLVFPVQHGWTSTDVFALDLKARGAAPFAVVENAGARFYPRFVRGELWMRTDLDAANNRVVAVDLRRPARDRWRAVLPEQPDVLDDAVLIGDAVYAQFQHDGSGRLARFDRHGVHQADLDVPPMHAAAIRGDGPGHAVITVESFATPETSYRVDLKTGERTIERGPEIVYDGSGVEVRQGAATSPDGTRVPVFVVHRRGLERDGDTPTLLFGYGGFYAGQRPSFSPLAAAWVEAGGVYALALLRGGSEFGEPWHRAGMLTGKQRVFDDFIAASEWLIAERYTSPARLGIRGTSNGGLLVGAALTQRPELYRAVFCGFPDVDILRFNQFTTTNNMPALLEYGDAAIQAQFDAIKQYSPYQRVQPNTAYPAVMLASGDLDTRVPPLAARKFTARLQAATTSGRPVFLRYHPKAGHAADRGMPFALRVEDTAAELAFFMRELGLSGSAGTTR